MDIDRDKYQGGRYEAKKRIKFCLDQIEMSKGFSKNITWDREVVPNVTIEEIVGALVSAEQELTENDE